MSRGSVAEARGLTLNLLEALIATADRHAWARYCRLAAQLEGCKIPPAPTFAIGSVEWQQQQDEPASEAENAVTAEEEAAGRRRLPQRGAPHAFAGAVSPFGAAGGATFDDFIARHRGSSVLIAEIDALERELIDRFETAGRSARYRATGFREGADKAVAPEWFGRMQLDFAENRVVLPDGSAIAGITVRVGADAAVGSGARGRPARIMLRQALIALWERGAFTAGTGNERVLALVLRELGLSSSDPPYGFKSAETVRKLRRALNMSL